MEAYVGILPSLQRSPQSGNTKEAEPHPTPIPSGLYSDLQNKETTPMWFYVTKSTAETVSLLVWMPIGKPHSSAGHEKGGANHVFLKEGGRNVLPRENAMLGSPPKYPGESFWRRKRGSCLPDPMWDDWIWIDGRD